MAITVTTYRYNNETNRDEAQETKVSYEGMVLATGFGRHHVCSDNAMIDSGEYCWAEIWTGSATERVEFYMGRGGLSAHAEIDASPETKEMADTYRKALAVVNKIKDAFKETAQQNIDATKVVAGCKVEVFKGRKVPKGIYYARTVGEGDFGPYAHLSDTPVPQVGSKLFSFISLGNMRRVDGPVAEQPYSDTVRDMANAVLDYSKYDAKVDIEAFLPLHDALVDDGKVEDAAQLDGYLFLVLAAV